MPGDTTIKHISYTDSDTGKVVSCLIVDGLLEGDALLSIRKSGRNIYGVFHGVEGGAVGEEGWLEYQDATLQNHHSVQGAICRGKKGALQLVLNDVSMLEIIGSRAEVLEKARRKRFFEAVANWKD